MKKRARSPLQTYAVQLPHCPLGRIKIQAKDENDALLQYAQRAGVVYTQTAAGDIRLQSDWIPSVKKEPQSNE